MHELMRHGIDVMKNVDIKPKLEIKVELDKDGMDEEMKHGIEVMKNPFQFVNSWHMPMARQQIIQSGCQELLTKSFMKAFKKFQCNQCNYVGAHKDHLLDHFDSVHLKKCTKCGSCFSTGYELSKHMRWNCVKKCPRCKIILPCGRKSEFSAHNKKCKKKSSRKYGNKKVNFLTSLKS